MWRSHSCVVRLSTKLMKHIDMLVLSYGEVEEETADPSQQSIRKL